MPLLSNTVPIEKQIQDMQVILEISNLMAEERSIDSLLQVLMSEITKVMDADLSTLFICDYENKELYSRVIQQEGVSEIRFPMDKGIAGTVVRTRETINIRDAYKDPRFNPDIDQETNYHTNTILCMPLINRRDEVVGVTQVLNKKGGFFSEYDEKLLAMLSHHVAISLDATMVYEENEALLKSVITALSTAIDARDPVTAGHSQRVSLYSLNLGKECGLSEKELGKLEIAGWLHDVGKIGVRDAVLLKAAKLTKEEYAKIQRHAFYTREILEQVHFPRKNKDVPFIAAIHHERMDGSGYPYGLKGEEIPITARIIAISDVFDAVTSYDRPYQKAVSFDKGFKILNECSGKLLDEKLVELFVRKKCYNIERRQYQRLSLDLAVEVVYLSHDKQREYAKRYLEEKAGQDKSGGEDSIFKTQLVNISGVGLNLKMNNFLPENNFVYVNFIINKVPLKILSRIVHVEQLSDETGYLTGMKFLDLTMNNRDRLVKQLQKISAADEQSFKIL